MNIILYKNTLYNTKVLYNDVNTKTFIDGFIVVCSMTSDDKIVVNNYGFNQYNYTVDLQNENYNELKENSFYELERFLNDFKDYKGKIILEMIGAPNIVGKPNKNYDFVMRLKEVISNYKNLNLYICSAYDDIIVYIAKELNNVKKGMAVDEKNLNYYDLDFYIAPSRMLDTKIVVQQLKSNKEMMFVLQSSEETIPLVDKFKKENYLFDGISSQTANKLLSVITEAPSVVNIVFNSKKN